MAELCLPEKVERWLMNHPGARVIVDSDSVELCARQLVELPSDPFRYMGRDVERGGRSAALLELVDDMLHWEVDDWRYEDESDAFLDAVVSAANANERGGR